MPTVKNTEWNWKDTGQKISMGEQVGKILKGLQATACIHVEEREYIAIMQMYADLFPEDTEFIEYLNKRAIPAFKHLGYGKWYRDVITDLALALSARGAQDKKTRTSTKKILSA